MTKFYYVITMMITVIISINTHANDRHNKPKNQSTASNSADDLAPFREKSLIALIRERLRHNVVLSDIAFHDSSRRAFAYQEGGIMAWLMVNFQQDIVDYNIVQFRVSASPYPIECKLYIREDWEDPNMLHINLHDCDGELAEILSGSKEYGLPNIIMSKNTHIQ